MTTGTILTPRDMRREAGSSTVSVEAADTITGNPGDAA